MKTILLLICALASANAAIVSTFDTGTDGWTGLTANPASTGFPVGMSASSVWDAAGFMKVSDVDDFDTFFAAPSAFLGNQLQALNTTLHFDLFAFNQPNYGGSLVVVKGGGLTLAYNPSSPAVVFNNWASQSVSLAPSVNWRVGTPTGSIATTSDFKTVFADVTALWISAENVGGIVETTGLDNVRLEQDGGPAGGGAGVPEPGSLALIAGAAAILGGCAYSNRRLNIL